MIDYVIAEKKIIVHSYRYFEIIMALKIYLINNRISLLCVVLNNYNRLLHMEADS